MTKSRGTLFDSIEAQLPPIFTRKEAARCLGGLLCASTLRNIDHRGEGPKVKERIGNKVLYDKNSFMEWLRTYRAR